MNIRKIIAVLMSATLCLSAMASQKPMSEPTVVSAENIYDIPQEYITACDWIWTNRIEPEGSCKGWSTIYDQIIAGKGTLQYILIWQSYETLTLEQRQKLPQMLENVINKWNDCLVGYDDWPVDHVEVKIIGYAVLDKNVLQDLQPDEVVFTETAVPWTRDWLISSGMGDSSIPELQPAEPVELSRYVHWNDKNWSYNGSYDNRFDMYLHGIHGMTDMGGVGYHYGQILSDHSIQGLINGTTSEHILLHEIGHGFGFPDYYGAEGASDGYPPGGFPGGQGSLMMAGSCSYINTFDKYFTQYAWSKLKSEPGRFDLENFAPITTQPAVTTTTTFTTTTTTTATTTTTTSPPIIAETDFTDIIEEVQLTENGGVIRFAEHGTYSFSGDDYYGGDDSKNLSYYESGDRVRIRFTYGVSSYEIISISELNLEYNSHTVRGDVDKNGVFDEVDLVLMQNWILSKPQTLLADWQAGDLDNSGYLDVFDLTLMKREFKNS